MASASTVSSALSESEYLAGSEELTPKTSLISPLTYNIEFIKSIPAVNKIWKTFIKEKRLQNKDRVNISKAIINECLKETPNKM